MRYTSHKKIALLTMPVLLVASLFAFTTQTVEQPEGTPLFITGITSYNSGMIVSQKGVRKVSIYSSDCKERLQEWELDETPTGVAVDGDRIYATVAGEHKNGVYFLSASDPSQKQFVETASGAGVPLVNKANGKLYVCNQFAGSISELDKTGSAVLRTVKVLREPKAAVLDKDGKYLWSISLIFAR